MKRTIINSLAGVLTLALVWAGVSLYQNNIATHSSKNNTKTDTPKASVEKNELDSNILNSNDILHYENENNLKYSEITDNKESQQKQSASQGSELKLKFFDVMTGYSVIPYDVQIRQREKKNIIQNFTELDIKDNGTINIPVENGTYDITVTANGYSPMTTFFHLNNQALNVNFNLEPLVPVKELTSSFIQSLQRNDGIVIVGFIVDDFTGKPLENVRIITGDDSANTTTQKNGFFNLFLPLPKNQDSVYLRNKIFFERKGYTSEVRKKFDMYPNGDMILQIRMKRGDGENIEDVLTNRNPDITIQSK